MNNKLDFEMIQELEENNFYMFGGIYLYKNETDPEIRNKQRIMDNMGNSLNYLSSINYDIIERESRSQTLSNKSTNHSYFRNKLNTYMDDLKISDSEEITYEAMEHELERLLEEKISSDILIILQRTPFYGNDIYDTEKCSIMFMNINDDIRIGFIIDKTCLQLYSILKDRGE